MLIVLFLLWIFLIILLNKSAMHFFKFIIGSTGLFYFIMCIGKGTADVWLEKAVTYCMWLAGNITSLYMAYPEYSMITVYYKLQAVSFLVDYECSGFIETLVYISLLTFYPLYGFRNKFILAFLGTLYIFISNVIRVFVICSIIKVFGTGMFFISHTIFARLLFFFLMVILYYYVFTRSHILRQKVGSMSYGN